MSDIGDLAALLAALPAQTNPAFGPQVRRLLETHDPALSTLLALVDDPGQPVTVRFAAFYAVQVRHWRRRDYGQHRELTDRYQSLFGDQPMFSFLLAEYYASQSGDQANLLAALHYARRAAGQLPEVPGVLHVLAEVIAEYQEQAETHQVDLVLEGERAVTRAIALSRGTYPKYFATLARLQILRGAYGEARRSVAIAIEQEDSTGRDYALRVGDYQPIRSRVQLAQQSGDLQAAQASALGEMRGARRETLEVLGLLAAVIAFLVTTTNLAGRFEPRAAAGLVLLTAGGIIVVFAAFHVLLVQVAWRRFGVSLGLSVALMATGWWILVS